MGENVEEKTIYVCEIYRKECVDIFQEVRTGIKLSSILKKVHPKSRKTEQNCSLKRAGEVGCSNYEHAV